METFHNFYASALDYCNWYEQIDDTVDKYPLHTIRRLLSGLYNTAITLPSVDLKADIDFDDKLPHHLSKHKLDSLAKIISEHRYYWIVSNPFDHEKDAERGYGDLLDDISDIYRDLKKSILIYSLEEEHAKETALWQFKFDFEYHWGNHCVNALTAIHYLISNKREE